MPFSSCSAISAQPLVFFVLSMIESIGVGTWGENNRDRPTAEVRGN